MSSFKKFQQAKQQKENKAKPRGGWDEDDNTNNRISNVNNTFGFDRGFNGLSNNFNSITKSAFSPNTAIPYEKKPEFDVKSVIHVENKLLEDLIVPSGISLKPNENQLKEFIKRCKSLDKEIIFNFLMDKLNNYANYNNNQEIKSFCKCLYVIEAILSAKVDELYQGFLEYKELFEEIKNHFSENKKVIDILNLIFVNLGVQINDVARTHNKAINNNNFHKNFNNLSNNNEIAVASNQSNINLFEGFVTETKNVNLLNNDLFDNTPNIKNNSNDKNFDLFKISENTSNNLNNQIQNNGIDLFNSFGNNNTNYIPNTPIINNLTDNINSNTNCNDKTFSFIKNKNSNSNNNLVNVQNANNIDLFSNLKTNSAPHPEIQKIIEIKNTNPNDFSDLFGSLKLNGSQNNANNNAVATKINIENNILVNSNNPSTNKKGFSFIKKEKHNPNENASKIFQQERNEINNIFSSNDNNNDKHFNTNNEIIDLTKMNQPTLDEIFDSRKMNNTNIDVNKLTQIYSENSQENKNNINNKTSNKNSNFNPVQLENLMNQNFNYNHVYSNIEHGKKEVDPFSFVDDLLKPKKI